METNHESDDAEFEAALDEAMRGRPEKLEELAKSNQYRIDTEEFEAALTEAQAGRPEKLDAFLSEGDDDFPICALLLQLRDDMASGRDF